MDTRLRKERGAVNGFLRRFVLSMVTSKLERMAHRRGHNLAVDGLLREVHYRIGHRPAYHHPRACGPLGGLAARTATGARHCRNGCTSSSSALPCW
jgi:hypothetical protein